MSIIILLMHVVWACSVWRGVKETYYSAKRGLLQCHKETYHSVALSGVLSALQSGEALIDRMCSLR